MKKFGYDVIALQCKENELEDYKIFFKNGYGLSIIKNIKWKIGDKNHYEIAVLNLSNKTPYDPLKYEIAALEGSYRDYFSFYKSLEEDLPEDICKKLGISGRVSKNFTNKKIENLLRRIEKL